MLLNGCAASVVLIFFDLLQRNLLSMVINVHYFCRYIYAEACAIVKERSPESNHCGNFCHYTIERNIDTQLVPEARNYREREI